jgi:protein-tyrosine phosphatase
MIRVLFVCLGNICRSPLAEGVFLKQVQALELDQQFQADSAGTASYHIGSLADKRSIQVAKEHGINLTHRARAFVADDFNRFDFIVAMDKQNKADILRLAPKTGGAKVVLMRDYDPKQQGGEVPDPYYGEIKDFEEVLEILDRSCTIFLATLLAIKARGTI